MDIKKGTKLISTVAIIVAIINFSVPYLILKDVTSYWANYLFWTTLTLIVIAGGIYYVRDWGERE